MPTCHYFNTKTGCKRSPCHFAHVSPPGSTTIDVKPASSSKNKSAPASAPPSTLPPVPPGACRSFYSSGKCKYNDNCKFRHVAPGKPKKGPTGGRIQIPQVTIPAPEEPALSGAETLRYLAKICAPTFSFTKPPHIVSFVKLLTTANPEKENWVRVGSTGRFICG
jgi:hypothetical protein